MAFANNVVQKMIKTKVDELETAFNAAEKEILSEDFDKARMSYKFARMQELFIELQAYMKNQSYL